jgi:outer membrane biosynthesis protein TonB
VTARLVHKVAPVYPSSARANHTEGTVVLQATISKKGRIRALNILSSPRENSWSPHLAPYSNGATAHIL